ncbi:MAG: response regulator [Methylobacter sp.]|nr:response regulator [Methylobacter sp.]
MSIILIASDNAGDAQAAKQLLKKEFISVFTSISPEQAVQDFESRRPDVLVLAFNGFEKAEHYYLELYRLSTILLIHPHRTILLCNNNEINDVYKLCQKQYLDDYILFWPDTDDVKRLPMAVHHAIRYLAVLESSPSAVVLVNQTRLLTELESLLDWNIAQGDKCIEIASDVIAHVEQEVKTTLDAFAQRLTQGDFANQAEIKDAQGLRHEISRLQQEEIHGYFNAAVESINPIKDWTLEFKQKCVPHLESARVLRTMAEKIPATLLVVDDDELMRKAYKTVLADENYELMFADSGIEALNLLRKRRPDLILMDMMMPDMDGVETIRRIKSVEQFFDIPVIMVTGHSEKDVVTNCLKVGAAGFVVKPFNRKVLLDKIREFLYEPCTVSAFVKQAPKEEMAYELDPSVLKKSWKNSKLFNGSKADVTNCTILEISWIQLKPGMNVVSVYFEGKPYIRNCIANQKIINNIIAVRENTGASPVIKIRVQQ